MLNGQKRQLEAVLESIEDPYLGKNLLEAEVLSSFDWKENSLSIHLELPYPAEGTKSTLVSQLQEKAQQMLEVTDVTVTIGMKIRPARIKEGIEPLRTVKNIIAVASGKGGVGKSTTSVNLALALAKEGAKVGLLDADIYGPSLPLMMGVEKLPKAKEGEALEPFEAHGVKGISIGLLVPKDEAVIWRGPVVIQALQQLLHQTNWGELDYLIMDLPPGTGDIQLTMVQKMPISAAVIVTTPQDMALQDATRAVAMFNKTKLPVMGVIENMSSYVCSSCGHSEAIFGEGGGNTLVEKFDLEFLGDLPLNLQLRKDCDAGTPTVARDPDGAIALIYRELARKVAAQLVKKASIKKARQTLNLTLKPMGKK